MHHPRYVRITVLCFVLTACGGTVLLGSERVAATEGVMGSAAGAAGAGGSPVTGVAGTAGGPGGSHVAGVAGTAGASGASALPRSGIYDADATAWCTDLSNSYAFGGPVMEGTKRASWGGGQRELSSQTDFLCFLFVPISVCAATLKASSCTAPLTLLSRCMKYIFPPPGCPYDGGAICDNPPDEPACEEYLAIPGCDGTLIRHAAVTKGPDGFDCPISYVGE